MSGYQWKVGEKAVCISDDWSAADDCDWPESTPKAGQIFTVDYMEIAGEALLLGFEEIPDFGFEAIAFRPLVKRKTDISIFRKMLKPTMEPADG